MDTYSVLQGNLGQALEPAVLEAAVDATRTITRMDCPRLQREISGIMVSGLDHEDALAFQAALAGRHYPTVVVADAELPVLHASHQVQRFDRREDSLVLTDSIGREFVQPLTALVFLAAGMHGRMERRSLIESHDSTWDGVPFSPRKVQEQSEMVFRCDLFFSEEPHRLHLGLGKDTAIFHQGQPIRLRNSQAVGDFMTALAALLPEERINSQLRQPATTLFYPNLHVYENEIRWHFQHFMAAGME